MTDRPRSISPRKRQSLTSQTFVPPDQTSSDFINLSSTLVAQQTRAQQLEIEQANLKRSWDEAEPMDDVKRLRLICDELNCIIKMVYTEIDQNQIRYEMHTIDKKDLRRLRGTLMNRRHTLKLRLAGYEGELLKLELRPRFSELYSQVEGSKLQRRAIVDRFLGSYPKRSGPYEQPKKRSGTEQTAFRNEFIQSYMSEYEDQPDWLWCPVLHNSFHKDDMIAAHIIPHSLPEQFINDLCGPMAAAYRFSARNGLLVHWRVEKAYDAGQILIVQTEDSPAEKPEFEIVTIEPDCLLYPPQRKPTEPGGQEEVRGHTVDRRKLQFRNDFRPARRLLFLKYAIERLILVDSESLSDRQIQLREELSQRKPWPTIGPYLARAPFLVDATKWLGSPFDENIWKDVLQSASDPPDPLWTPVLTHDVPEADRQVITGSLLKNTWSKAKAATQEGSSEVD